jgi:hypothetical protein
MNGFLVFVRCNSDDLPIGLFATEDEAITFAWNNRGNDALKTIEDVLNIDASPTICTHVIEFKNGVPVGFRTVY